MVAGILEDDFAGLSADTFVQEEEILLPNRIHFIPSELLSSSFESAHEAGVKVFPVFRFHLGSTPLVDDAVGGLTPLAHELVRQHEEIEVPVVIGIGEGWHDARTHRVEAEFLSPFREARLPVIEEQLVGRLVVADIEIQVAVVIDVDHRGPRPPAIAPTDSRLRKLSKFQLAAFLLQVESVLSGAAREEEIRQRIAVHISDRHPTRRVSHCVKALHGMRGIERIDESHPCMLNREIGEQGRPIR